MGNSGNVFGRRTFVKSAGVIASIALADATSISGTATAATAARTVFSPNGRVQVSFDVVTGCPRYTVFRDARPVIVNSGMGFELIDGVRLDRGFEIVEVTEAIVDEEWSPVWGPASTIRNNYHELVVHLRRPAVTHTRLDIVFRVFDDGVGFRYVFPTQAAQEEEIVITDELTEFRFTGNHRSWAIPANYDSYEYLYHEIPLDQIGTLAPGDQPQSSIGIEVPNTAATPITVKVADDLYVALHEAALVDFADMMLTLGDNGFCLRSALVPLKDQPGVKVRTKAPRSTPWRTIVMGDRPGDLIESHLVLNLNEPCALADTSWIRPGKYVGVWWAVHKGQRTWAPGSNLGATTEEAKRYIDFAAVNNIPYVLAEGWNVGWAKGAIQDFLTPNPKFDVREVIAYGRSRGVGFLAHNETSGDLPNYERQIDRAFIWYEELGLPGVKTGYAGNIADHHHGDQWMVNHYQRVVDKAAEHRLMIDAHEPIKPTGLERTYPHMLTREGVRGLEWEAWSAGNPAAHTTTLPFTRMLAGPLDYTPGIFDVTWLPEQAADDVFGDKNDHSRVHTTRAHQLALYPVLLSGLQMLADVPENYEGQPELEFLRHVPTTWDETKVVDGEIGDYISIARRSGPDWYVGTLTDENARVLDIPLAFLGPGRYTAYIYRDAPENDYEKNPNAVCMSRRTVTAAMTIHAILKPSGGHAMRLVKTARGG